MKTTLFLILAAFGLEVLPARADVLVRTDETSVKGTFKGGTDAVVMFETGGQVQQVPIGNVFCLLFSARPAAAPGGQRAEGPGSWTLLRKNGTTLRGAFKGGTDAALLFEVSGKVEQVNVAEVLLVVNEPTPPPAPTSMPTAVVSGTAPAGTKLLVTLVQDVTTATHQTGAVVEGMLATPLTVNGALLAPEGTKVFGKVLESRGGKVLGGAHITIAFTSLQMGTASIPIQTTEVGAEAGRGGTAKKVGAGALIGAAAGDAGVGAAVGGGVALLTSGGNHLKIPKGTKAEVSLKVDAKFGE